MPSRFLSDIREGLNVGFAELGFGMKPTVVHHAPDGTHKVVQYGPGVGDKIFAKLEAAKRIGPDALYAARKMGPVAAAEHALTSPFRQDDFREKLEQKFGSESAQKVLEVFEKLQIPAPKSGTEFLNAYDGVIAFSNGHGMTIRVEHVKSVMGNRLDDNPWVLKPIAAIDAGQAKVEICPGCHTNDKDDVAVRLRSDLAKTGADFWDMKANNTGILPIKTPGFPDGIPVVIDRLAVRSEGASTNIADALQTMGVKKDPQDVLYGDLRKSFKDAWPKGAENPHSGLMRKFWADCKVHVAQGKVIEGWNEKRDDRYKIVLARNSANAYTPRIKEGLAAPASTKFDKPDLSSPFKIVQYQEQILQAERVLPEHVTLKGVKMPLNTALRDEGFNAHFRKTLEAVHGKGEIDMTGPIKTIDKFNQTEAVRKNMIAALRPAPKPTAVNMAAKSAPATPKK